MNYLLIFLAVYIPFVVIIVVFGYLVQRIRESRYQGSPDDHILLADLVVIVPFRNEEKRIRTLLNTIEKLNFLPKEFVFVDDHSEDGTVSQIKTLSGHVPYRILSVSGGTQGKKAGIREGINGSESEFILTIDADVELQEDFFLHVSRLSKADMYLMPAVMVARRFHEHLFEVDLLLINAINTGLAGLARPIIASGANLLFRREAFERLDRLHTHAHMPSGDDIYLLRDFRVGKADVRLISSPMHAVHTETPQSFREFIHQRLRWIAKTGDVKDHLSTFLAVVQALLTFTFVILIVFLFFTCGWKSALIAFFAKTGVDLLAFLPFFNRVRRIRSWLFIPLYEILFPIYSLMIISMMYVFKPEWKGRKMNTNF